MSVPPTHRVRFADTETIVSMAYSADSKEVFVALNLQSVNGWRLIVEYWHWTLGACVALFVLISLFVLARALKRPRKRARLYCRKCNYEISTAQTRCPECGKPLDSPRAIVRGRSLLRRIGPVLIVTAAVALAYGGFWMLPSAQVRSLSARFHWWSDGILRFGRAHQIAGITRLEEERRRSRIAVIDVASGRRIRELGTFPVAYRDNPNGDQRIVVAPDGASLYALRDGWSFVALDPHSGAVQHPFALDPPALFADLAGITPDGAAIYATFYDRSDNIAMLARFDAQTGASTIVKTVPGDIMTHSVTHEEMRFPPRFHLVPYASEPTFIQTPSQRLILRNEIDRIATEFWWFLERAPEELQDFSEWVASDSRPMPFGDEGKMLFRPGFSSLCAFDPATGRTQLVGLSHFRPPLYAPINENGVRRFVFGGIQSPIDPIGAYDLVTNAPVDDDIMPMLGFGQPGLLTSITTSPDLTSLAAIVFRSGGNAAGAQHSYDLVIYDLTPYPKLRELEFGDQRDPSESP